MTRAVVVVAVVALCALVALGIASRPSSPTGAQDDTAGRLAAVESQVAGNGTEVAGLRRRVQRLERRVLTPAAATPVLTPTPAASPAEATPAAVLTFTGTADTVTTASDLPSGLARVAAAHEGDSTFVVLLYPEAGGTPTLVVNTIGAYDGERLVRVDRVGRYVLEVRASGPWHITIEP